MLPMPRSLKKLLPLQYPLIQGPFGGGLSSVELAATVSNCGGLGSFGVHHLAPAAIREISAELRAKTSKPFALNLWVSNHDHGAESVTAEQYEQYAATFYPWYQSLGITAPPFSEYRIENFNEQVEAVIESAPAAFSFVFGIPDQAILGECRKRGIVTIGTATTVDEAVAIAEAGVDVVVATSFEAGGHRVSFLQAAEDSLFGAMALIPQVVDAVGIPVVAAGGIADARGVAAAFALGASGVQIGTAFLACNESAAPVEHRAALFSSRSKQTVLSRAYSGRLARFIENEFTKNPPESILPYPLQSWFTSAIKRAALAVGREELVSFYSSQAAPLLRHRTAADFIGSIRDALDGKSTLG
jgi:nitronate monooxygenase